MLVVRLGAMGDVLHALPAITALRKAHPAWIIDWAIDPRWRSLLTAEPVTAGLAEPVDGAEPETPTNPQSVSQTHTPARPVVDRLHLVPTKSWGRRPFSRETRDSIRALRADLKAGSYDAVLDVQGAIRSAIIGRLSGCRRIVGEAKPREALARWLYTERIETAGVHVVEQDVELASAIAGDLLNPAAAELPWDAESEYWCDQHEEVSRAEWAGKPILLIHPGAGWGAKRWPPDRYGVVAMEFARRGAVILVNVGPGEEHLGQAVVDSSDGAAVVVASTLSQLTALTRRASVVIGGDSGPLHLANALGRPVVGIYGPTDPKRNGPFGGAFRVLRNPESRRDHTRREETEAGLLTILPEDVISATLQLLLEARGGFEDSSAPVPSHTSQDRDLRPTSALILEAGDILEAEPIADVEILKPKVSRPKRSGPRKSKIDNGQAHA